MNRPPKFPSDLPLLAWGDERATRKARIKRQLYWSAGIAGLLLLVSTIAAPPKPLLVWNASPSAPIGLYFVHHSDHIMPGDMVVAWPPKAVRRLAADRRYIPYNVPLVKRVAAADHDWVCAFGDQVTIDGGWIIPRRKLDGKGRRLPWWQGCKLVEGGQLFLMIEEHSDSFDGRYFGVTEPADVIGKAELLWAKPSQVSSDE